MDYSDRIKLYDKLFPLGLFALSIPFIIFIVIGMVKGDLLFMAIGAVLSGIPILTDFFKGPIRSKFLVEPMLNDSIHRMEVLTDDIDPRSFYLKDVLEAVKNSHLGDALTLVRERDLAYSGYALASRKLVEKLVEYPQIQKYFMLEVALNDEVINISPSTYALETKPYLQNMQQLVQGDINDIVYKDSLYRVKEAYLNERKEFVGQMNYNLKELYKIASARKTQEYQRRFEEMMGDGWLPSER